MIAFRSFDGKKVQGSEVGMHIHEKASESSLDAGASSI
jgi:hypothetical protein